MAKKNLLLQFVMGRNNILTGLILVVKIGKYVKMPFIDIKRILLGQNVHAYFASCKLLLVISGQYLSLLLDNTC